MIWIILASTIFSYLIIITYLVFLTNKIWIRIIFILTGLCLPSWNILPAWAYHRMQCMEDGGVNIIKPFNADAIIMHDRYYLKSMPENFDNKLNCDGMCQRRLKSYFSQKMQIIILNNNIAIETSNIDPYIVPSRQHEDLQLTRFWLTNIGDKNCVTNFYETIPDNNHKKNRNQVLYKDKCIAAKQISHFSTPYEYVDNPLEECPVSRDKFGTYIDHRRCRYSDKQNKSLGITKYGAKILKGKEVVATVNTYSFKANTFVFVPTIKSQFCSFHNNRYDFKELLMSDFLESKL